MVTYLDPTLAIDHYMWAEKNMPSNTDATAPGIEFSTKTKLTLRPYFNCAPLVNDLRRAEGY